MLGFDVKCCSDLQLAGPETRDGEGDNISPYIPSRSIFPVEETGRFLCFKLHVWTRPPNVGSRLYSPDPGQIIAKKI